MLWSAVFADGAVVAYEFLTGLTVELKLLALVQGAIQRHLLQSIQLLHILLKFIDGNNFMLSQCIPLAMNISACCTDKPPTVMAVACCSSCVLFTVATLNLLWFFHLLLYLKEMVNVEG